MPLTTTPNMNLLEPTVGQELAPTWATDLNSSLSIIDQHNHASGNGVQISPTGLNISSDLSFIGNNATQLRSARFTSQVSPISLPGDLDCIYVSGVDLYYNDGNGNQVRLTISGGVAGTPGSIGGLVSPASVTYVSATPAYVFQSAASTSANLDAGSITIRENILNAKGITLQSPTALANDYSLTLPTSLPSVLSILLVDPSGNISTTDAGSAGGFVPTGTMLPYAGAAAPAGYLICDGSSKSTTTYAALFAVVAYTYGGAGANFNVPDTRRQVLMGAGGTAINGPSNALGSQGGSENPASHNHVVSSTTLTENQAHTHNTQVFPGQTGTIAPLKGFLGAINGPDGTFATSFESTPHTHNFSGTTTTSGTGTTGNVQPSLVVNYIIKT